MKRSRLDRLVMPNPPTEIVMGEWFLSKKYNRLDVFWIAGASTFFSHGRFGYAFLMVVVGVLAVSIAEAIQENRSAA